MKIFWLGVHLHFGNIRLRFLFILWTYSHTESLSDILVDSTGSIQVSHPIYISVVCFATWLIVSCYKHLEPNPVLSLIPLLWNHFLLGPSPHLVLCAFRSELLFSHALPKVTIRRPSLLQQCWGKICKWAAIAFLLPDSSPPSCGCLSFSVNPSDWEACRFGTVEEKFSGYCFFFSFPSVLRKGSMDNGEIIIPAAMKQ